MPSDEVWHCSTVEVNLVKVLWSSWQALFGRSGMLSQGTLGSLARCLQRKRVRGKLVETD